MGGTSLRAVIFSLALVVGCGSAEDGEFELRHQAIDAGTVVTPDNLICGIEVNDQPVDPCTSGTDVASFKVHKQGNKTSVAKSFFLHERSHLCITLDNGEKEQLFAVCHDQGGAPRRRCTSTRRAALIISATAT